MRRARASSRTAGERSAVIRIAGRSAPKRRRSAAIASMPLPLVEMIVDQQAVRRALASLDGGERRLQIRRLEHLAAPAAQQRLHAVENRRLVVDAQHGDAGELAAIDARGVALPRARAAARRERGTSTEKREPRPTVESTSIV